MRRLVPLLILLAMAITPFGRAQAQPIPQHSTTMAMSGYCEPGRPADAPPAHHQSIDCMIACAGMAAIEAGLTQPALPPVATLMAAPVLALHGIGPQFDPPPPRIPS